MSELKPTAIKVLKDTSIFADGQIVNCLQGTITTLFEPKKGGDWEYQNGTLKDAAGDEIKICFSKCSQPKTVKGKVVTFKSTKTENFGLQGVKVEDSTFESKKKGGTVTERIVKITPSCEITFEGGTPAAEQQPSGNGKPQATATATGGDWNDHPRFVGPNAHPKQAIDDMLFLQRHCRVVAKTSYAEEKLEPELLEHLSTSLFIESCKNGLHKNFIKRMQAPEPVEIKPAPKDPKNWRSCQVPKGELAGQTLEDISDERLKAYYQALKEKGSTSDFANCVYAAATERDLLPPPQKEADPDDDDIPYN